MKLQKAIKAALKLCMQVFIFMMSHIQSSVRCSAAAVFKVAAKIT